MYMRSNESHEPRLDVFVFLVRNDSGIVNRTKKGLMVKSSRPGLNQVGLRLKGTIWFSPAPGKEK